MGVSVSGLVILRAICVTIIFDDIFNVFLISVFTVFDIFGIYTIFKLLQFGDVNPI
jgi:hypothetical protein